MSVTNVKRPSESRRYSISFEKLLVSGDTIASITSITAAPGGLTISSNTVDSPRARFRVSGGTDGVLYTITAVVVTTGGDTLEEYGLLEVSKL